MKRSCDPKEPTATATKVSKNDSEANRRERFQTETINEATFLSRTCTVQPEVETPVYPPTQEVNALRETVHRTPSHPPHRVHQRRKQGRKVYSPIVEPTVDHHDPDI